LLERSAQNADFREVIQSDFSFLSSELTESSRAETIALLLGEDFRGKQDQAERCA
jgi:hypothetical protein